MQRNPAQELLDPRTLLLFSSCTRQVLMRQGALSVPVILGLGSTLLCPAAAWLMPTPSTRGERLAVFRSAAEQPSSWREPSAPAKKTRRDSLQDLLGTALLGLTLAPGMAKAEEEITEKVYLDLEIGSKPAGRVVLGLYGKAAPVTTDNFLKLVEGRGTAAATYVYSTVFRVEKGKCIDLGRITGGGGKKLEKKINESGYMRVSSSNAAEWTRNDEVNGLKHDTPFLLTTKKGGGTYEFSITLAADRKLDSDHIVFGRMLEGGDVVDAILKVPVSKEDPIGSKQVFASAGKQFDPRAKIIFLNKPLRKIVIKDCGRLV